MAPVRDLQEMCINRLNKIREPTLLMKCLSTIPRIPEIFMKPLLRHKLDVLESQRFGYDVDLLKCVQSLLSLWPREEICLSDMKDEQVVDFSDKDDFSPRHYSHDRAGTILLDLFGDVIINRPHQLKSLDISTCLLSLQALRKFRDKCDPFMSECGNKRYKLTISLDSDVAGEICEKLYPWLDLRVKHLRFCSDYVLPKYIQPEALQYLTSLGIYNNSNVTSAILQEFKSMSIKPTITSLRFSSMCNHDKLKSLIQSSPSLTRLGILDINPCITSILSVINQPLTHLALQDCSVKDEHISKMCGMTNLYALEYLDLSYNNLKGFHNIVTFISKIKYTLKTLELQRTGSEDQILIDICKQLSESPNEITIDLTNDYDDNFHIVDHSTVKMTMLGILPPNSQVLIDDIMYAIDSDDSDYHWEGYAGDFCTLIPVDSSHINFEH